MKRNHVLYESEALVPVLIGLLLGIISCFEFGTVAHYLARWIAQNSIIGIANMALGFGAPCVYG